MNPLFKYEPVLRYLCTQLFSADSILDDLDSVTFENRISLTNSAFRVDAFTSTSADTRLAQLRGYTNVLSTLAQFNDANKGVRILTPVPGTPTFSVPIGLFVCAALDLQCVYLSRFLCACFADGHLGFDDITDEDDILLQILPNVVTQIVIRDAYLHSGAKRLLDAAAYVTTAERRFQEAVLDKLPTVRAIQEQAKSAFVKRATFVVCDVDSWYDVVMYPDASTLPDATAPLRVLEALTQYLKDTHTIQRAFQSSTLADVFFARLIEHGARFPTTEIVLPTLNFSAGRPDTAFTPPLKVLYKTVGAPDLIVLRSPRHPQLFDTVTVPLGKRLAAGPVLSFARRPYEWLFVLCLILPDVTTVVDVFVTTTKNQVGSDGLFQVLVHMMVLRLQLFGEIDESFYRAFNKTRIDNVTRNPVRVVNKLVTLPKFRIAWNVYYNLAERLRSVDAALSWALMAHVMRFRPDNEQMEFVPILADLTRQISLQDTKGVVVPFIPTLLWYENATPTSPLLSYVLPKVAEELDDVFQDTDSEEVRVYTYALLSPTLTVSAPAWARDLHDIVGQNIDDVLDSRRMLSQKLQKRLKLFSPQEVSRYANAVARAVTADDVDTNTPIGAAYVDFVRWLDLLVSAYQMQLSPRERYNKVRVVYFEKISLMEQDQQYDFERLIPALVIPLAVHDVDARIETTLFRHSTILPSIATNMHFVARAGYLAVTRTVERAAQHLFPSFVRPSTETRPGKRQRNAARLLSDNAITRSAFLEQL